MRKTQEHLSIFARFRDEQTVTAVEGLLKSPENQDLHPFEVAQLGSLTCEEAEEAKTLIPSLANKKTDEELQLILDQVSYIWFDLIFFPHIFSFSNNFFIFFKKTVEQIWLNPIY